MIRVYVPYYDWEDWINGMWRKLSKEDEQSWINKAVEFTGDHIRYGNAMKSVVEAWPKTMLNSLTNVSINRRAFLGHCACSYAFNCPEYITRIAWGKLTDRQRYLADKVAYETIKEYERVHNGIYINMGEQVLF
jgi:hypothetical protein